MIVSDGRRAVMTKIVVLFVFGAQLNVTPTETETLKELHLHAQIP